MSDSMFGSLLNMLDKHLRRSRPSARATRAIGCAGHGVVDRRDAGWHGQQIRGLRRIAKNTRHGSEYLGTHILVPNRQRQLRTLTHP